ncbi:MAG TPA: hypothetical protein VFT43_12490 [Candidatus Polarisedimenticolia bacterium]|nr:hypothetical protein [Candidatus Polarisedimenticolia bacterium]
MTSATLDKSTRQEALARPLPPLIDTGEKAPRPPAAPAVPRVVEQDETSLYSAVLRCSLDTDSK